MKDRVVTLTGTVDSLMEKVAAGEDAWNVPGVADVDNNLEIIRIGQFSAVWSRQARYRTRGEKRPREEERPGDRVRQDVWNALAHDIRVDPDQIGVEVVTGTVYLEGTVTSLYDKRVLTEIVGRIKGVLGVVNQVRVIPTAERPDGEVAAEIEAALANDVRLAGAQIAVKVSEGVVRLAGKVDSYVERFYAESDAWAAPGVVDIINDLEVKS